MRRLVCLLLVLPQMALAQEVRVILPNPDHPVFHLMVPVQGFDCSDRSCKALRSCEEACHKLLVCGQRKRDGDNDGIPCENLCSRRC